MQKNFARAERDNDLIYHQDVPSLSALPHIQGVSMVQSAVHVHLADPKAAIGDDGVIFADLLGWGARVAIGKILICEIRRRREADGYAGTSSDIYNDRRQNWLKDEVIDRAQQLDDVATK